MPQKRIRPPKEELYNLYIKEKKSAKEIGKILGVTSVTVHKWRKIYGIETQFNPPPSPQKEQLEDLYTKKFLSQMQIAKKFNVNYQIVARWLKEQGIRRRKRCSLKKEFSKEVANQVYKINKVKVSQIAKGLGVSPSAICLMLRDYGLLDEKDAVLFENACILTNGYRYISIDGKRNYEHRFVMEKKIGRKLKREEHVHHIDGNKLNNHIDNLEILSSKDHFSKNHKNVKNYLDLKSGHKEYKEKYESLLFRYNQLKRNYKILKEAL